MQLQINQMKKQQTRRAWYLWKTAQLTALTLAFVLIFSMTWNGWSFQTGSLKIYCNGLKSIVNHK